MRVSNLSPGRRSLVVDTAAELPHRHPGEGSIHQRPGGEGGFPGGRGRGAFSHHVDFSSVIESFMFMLGPIVSAEQGNARPHGVLPGRPESSASRTRREARSGVQVRSHFPCLPFLCSSLKKPENIIHDCSSPLYSKPLIPSTLTNKALPFIKVVEIKS